MKPRMSVARCCCGGTPPGSCLICSLGDCGWTASGSYLQSDTLHPLGSRRGIIESQITFPSIGNIAYLAWDFTNSSNLNYLRITRTATSTYQISLFERTTAKQSITRSFASTTLDVCLRYDETTAFAIVSSGASMQSLFDSINSTTTSRIARRVSGASINSLDWWQHPADMESCPVCSVPCADCCSGETPYAWQVTIAGPLTNNFYSNCSAVNGSYIVPVVAGSNCYWYINLNSGLYDEGISTCFLFGPRASSLNLDVELEKSGDMCRLVATVFTTTALDPADNCFGVYASYATPYAPVGTYCTGSHTLTLENSPTICLGFPATIEATALF